MVEARHLFMTIMHGPEDDQRAIAPTLRSSPIISAFRPIILPVIFDAAEGPKTDAL